MAWHARGPGGGDGPTESCDGNVMGETAINGCFSADYFGDHFGAGYV